MKDSCSLHQLRAPVKEAGQLQRDLLGGCLLADAQSNKALAEGGGSAVVRESVIDDDGREIEVVGF